MTTAKTPDTQKPDTSTQHTDAHIIWNDAGEVQKITLDDTEASMAASENLTVTTNASIEEIAEELASIPPRDVMDEKTWSYIGPIITQNMMSRAHQYSQDCALDDDQDEGMAPG